MKNFKFLFVVSLCLCLFGCSRSEEELIEEPIDCIFPSSNNGEYRFTLPSDIIVTEGYKFVPGDFRIFYGNEPFQNLGYTFFYFKAPKTGDEFELNTKDILAGKVDYNLICPSCNTVDMTPVAGYVKGVNTTPKNPADKQVWLVEAKLYRESSFKQNGVSLLKDTVNIKQYFYPNFVFN